MDLPSPLPPNENRGHTATVIFLTESIIAFLVVLLRFYARRTIRSLGIDDYFMLLTSILFLAFAGTVTKYAQLGGFRHAFYIEPQNVSQVIILILAGQSLTVLGYGTGKFSVGYLVLRLLPPNSVWRKRLVWIIMSIALLWNFLQAVLTWFECKPSKAIWDIETPGTCWTINEKYVDWYSGTVFNVLVDIFLATIPATVIWKLKLSLRRRIELCAILSLGLAAAVCGTIKITNISSLGDLVDQTWGTYDLDIWSGSELFAIIVCGSIPPLKVLWDRAMVKKPNSSEARYRYNDMNTFQMMRMRNAEATQSTQDLSRKSNSASANEIENGVFDVE